nr:hypothetical protein [Tanacetum cinerariifolium]
MDVEIEQDDLNQKFLTSLAPEWLMYTIVWRNISDLDTMSLDDLYNHLKVYEPEVKKKSESNSHNMAFISSAKNNNSQSNGSQIKYEDINQIDEDDIKKIDIKWNMALLNDTITDYSRPSPSIESNSNDLQSSNSSVSDNGESSSSILSKPVITFVKAADSPT